MPQSAARIQTFPGFAVPDQDGYWEASFPARISRQSAKPLDERMIVRTIRRMVDDPEFRSDCELFQERIADFVSHPIRGAKLIARVNDSDIPLSGATRRSGLTTACLRLPQGVIDDLVALCKDESGWCEIPIRSDEASSPAVARVQLLPRQGLSIISDIDDTLKETEITDRRQMLINTFWRDFFLVDGIQARLATWRQQGADFHYVSNSPWQLCDALQEFFREVELPRGSFHLREFRLRDHVLRPVRRLRRSSKETAIRRLLRAFPKRRFILLGDSCDRDPEVYGEVARHFHGQVAGIWIRDVYERRLTDERLERAFAELEPGLWTTYRNSDELPLRLDELGAHPRVLTS